MKCVDCGQEIKPNEDRRFVAVTEAEGNLYACGSCAKKIREEMRRVRQDFLKYLERDQAE